MRPKSEPKQPQRELFQVDLEHLIDLHHPLAELARQIDWSRFDRQFGGSYHASLGAPGISTRLMVALHYLKYQHDLSDEDVVFAWVENPYMQYFSGERYFRHSMPIDPSSMTRWRQRLGEAGAEQMLRETLEAGMRMKAIRPAQLQRVNVDTTVQTKAVRFPTDARLYHRMRERLVKAARGEGLLVKQSYRHVGKRLLMQSSRYAHARQMKRARACTRQLRTQLGRVVREIERQVEQPSERLKKLLATAHRIHTQQRHDKNKVYSVHEPEVQCIAKGKAGKPYEFGNKVSVAVSSRGGWLVGAKSFSTNPYDGHTLAAQIEQVEQLIGDRVREVHVDMGYGGHNYAGKAKVHVDKRQRGRTPKALWKRMKHRAAVEPGIGHLKNEHRLERNRLKGVAGDAVNAVLAAAAMNFRKLLRACERKLVAQIQNILDWICGLWNYTSLKIALQNARNRIFQDRLTRLESTHFSRECAGSDCKEASLQVNRQHLRGKSEGFVAIGVGLSPARTEPARTEDFAC
jgi:IS5 family transposase